MNFAKGLNLSSIPAGFQNRLKRAVLGRLFLPKAAECIRVYALIPEARWVFVQNMLRRQR